MMAGGMEGGAGWGWNNRGWEGGDIICQPEEGREGRSADRGSVKRGAEVDWAEGESGEAAAGKGGGTEARLVDSMSEGWAGIGTRREGGDWLLEAGTEVVAVVMLDTRIVAELGAVEGNVVELGITVDSVVKLGIAVDTEMELGTPVDTEI
jgi:hypothetical protein